MMLKGFRASTCSSSCHGRPGEQELALKLGFGTKQILSILRAIRTSWQSRLPVQRWGCLAGGAWLGSPWHPDSPGQWRRNPTAREFACWLSGLGSRTVRGNRPPVAPGRCCVGLLTLSSCWPTTRRAQRDSPKFPAPARAGGRHNLDEPSHPTQKVGGNDFHTTDYSPRERVGVKSYLRSMPRPFFYAV